MSDLRSQLIKLAHSNPELRKDLLPLLKEAAKIPAKLKGKKLDSLISTTYYQYGNGVQIDMMSIPKIYQEAKTAYDAAGTPEEGGKSSGRFYPGIYCQVPAELNMSTLRSQAIKLAHSNPELRPHLLPLLKKEAVVKMEVDGNIRSATLLLTFTYTAAEGLKVTAKNDQINPKIVPEYMKTNVTFMYRTLKEFVQKVRLEVGSKKFSEGAVVQMGAWSKQESWSDDSGYVVKSDNDAEFAKEIASVLPKQFPITGGGVPGSTSYRGSGWRHRGPYLWVWNDSSFGIGS